MNQRFAWLALCFAVGCADARGTLVVDVRSDFVAGVEVTRVETEIGSATDGDVRRESRAVTLGDDLLEGVRVAEHTVTQSATVRVTVQLIGPDGVRVGERRTLVAADASETVGVTVLISRDCATLRCPGAGDAPEATECLGGRCVPPECRPEEPSSCGEGECVDGSDCEAPAGACAEADCVEGICVARTNPDACGAMQWCDPERGCRDHVVLDAGRDAGLDAGGGTDAGPVGVDSGPMGTDSGPPDTGSGVDAGPMQGFLCRDDHRGGTATRVYPFGMVGDVPLSGDWDGDGIDTPGVRRGRQFLLSNDGTTTALTVTYGVADDTPLVGDWDGDGVDTIGVWRAGDFLLRNRNTNGPAEITYRFGNGSDSPLVGDWDGDGVDTAGVRRAPNLVLLRNSNTSGPAELEYGFGSSGDAVIVGDWDGDGRDTVGVQRGRSFFLRNAHSSGAADLEFGFGTGEPGVPGDWDGNGTSTLGVFRP